MILLFGVHFRPSVAAIGFVLSASAAGNASDPACPIPVEAFSDLPSSLQEYRDVIATGVNRLHENHPPCTTIDPSSVAFVEHQSSHSNPVFSVKCTSEEFPDGLAVKFSADSVLGVQVDLDGMNNIACGSLKTPSLNKGQWVKFGDWRVRVTSDDMDPVPSVVLMTELNARGPGMSSDRELAFGFKLIGEKVLSVNASITLGRNYWPHCDFDTASYSISGSRARFISTVDNAGRCNTIPIDGHLISSFKAGQMARLRLNRTDGSISLTGFSAAWGAAMEHSKTP